MIEFIIPGTPIAKGRPRLTTRGGFARAYTPEKTRKAEESFIAKAYAHRPSAPLTGPLSVALVFTFAVPDSWSRRKRAAALGGTVYHTTKPDADNLVKATLDAMQGVFFADDKQIVQMVVLKLYGTTPHTQVAIAQIDEEAA